MPAGPSFEAVHEAGHAVVGSVLGTPWTEVTMPLPGGLAGSSDPREKSDPQNEAFVDAAGPVAEVLLSEEMKADLPDDFEERRGGHRLTLYWHQVTTPMTLDEFESHCWTEASRLLRSRWGAVLQVAHELDRDRRVLRERVNRIVSESPGAISSRSVLA